MAGLPFVILMGDRGRRSKFGKKVDRNRSLVMQ
jgi:hypothetical protein